MRGSEDSNGEKGRESVQILKRNEKKRKRKRERGRRRRKGGKIPNLCYFAHGDKSRSWYVHKKSKQ